MTLMRVFLIAAFAAAPALGTAQDDALAERVMTRVRSALVDKLAFPPSDEHGALPADGRAVALWMVRPHQPGDLAIEILANPLNEEYQRRAAKAMAQIEASIEAAQRRAELQYERALAEAKRTRKSQDVDGVSLSDEGVAGARIDADSHVVVEVLFNRPSYRFEIASSTAPSATSLSRVITIPEAVAVITVLPNVYRDSQTEEERFCERQTLIYLGRVGQPSIDRRAGVFDVTAAGTPSEHGAAISSVVIRLRGNEALQNDLLQKGNWSSLLELLK